MTNEKGFFRDAGPVILRLEQRSASWSRLEPAQFRRLLALLLALGLGLALLTWSRVRVLADGYQLAELRQERDALLAQQRRLQRRLDSMRSLQYAEQAARNRLGMVDINPNQVITLRRQDPPSRLEAWLGRGRGADKEGR